MKIQPVWRHIRLILAGALLYLAFLFVQMPAAWLARQLPVNSPLQLQRVVGHLWRGEAGQVVWRRAADNLVLGPLRWDLQLGASLTGGPTYSFQLGHAPQPLTGQLRYAGDGLHLRDVRGQIDAAVLGMTSRALGLLQPEGRLALDIAELQLSDKLLQGEAQVDWLSARSRLVGVPLGDYRVLLRAQPDGRAAQVSMQTLRGDLAMNGQGEWRPGKGLQGSLTLLPPSDARRGRYTTLLNMLGKPNAAGAWVLVFAPY